MTRSFIDSVESKIVTRRPGTKTWFEKLDSKSQAELNVVKKKFQSGKYGSKQLKSLCRAIIAAAKERGWGVNGIQSVETWLKRPL